MQCPPSLFTGVSPWSVIAQEEIFGPVVLMTFRTPAEAVRVPDAFRRAVADFQCGAPDGEEPAESSSPPVPCAARASRPCTAYLARCPPPTPHPEIAVNPSPPPADLDRIRAEAAAEERAAILSIIEQAMRQLAHGHGATGAQALQHVADQIQRRDATASVRPY